MTIRSHRRSLAHVLAGTYLALSPWICGMSWDVRIAANATLVGVCIVLITLWGVLISGSQLARWVKVSLGGWLLVSPVALGLADWPAALSAWVVGALVLTSADTARFALPARRTVSHLRRRCRAPLERPVVIPLYL